MVTVDQCELEVLMHPPYSPDLAPSDYHLFGPMKKMLGGRNLHLILNCNQLFVSGLDSNQRRFFSHQAFRNLLTDGLNI